MKRQQIFVGLVALSLFVSMNLFATQIDRSYTVKEITAMNSRKIEALKEFKIKGLMGTRVSLGIKTAKLKDVNTEDYVLITTQQKTLPGEYGEKVKIRCKLKSIKELGSKRIIILEEVL